MNQIDVMVFSLITLGVTTAVQVIKKLFPSWSSGKEEALAAALPVMFVITAKVLHGFKDTGWVEALFWALGGGLTAGVVHDKLLNPMIKREDKSPDKET